MLYNEKFNRSIRPIPDKKQYESSHGDLLRELYAVAVLRALTPAERSNVLRTIG